MSGPTAVTIGNFDGVHLGHRALIQAAADAVGPAGSVIALSFDPHPASVLRPQSTPGRLTAFAERAVLLRDLGVDQVHRLIPSKDFLALEPEQFLEQITSQWTPAYIVEGEDFRFGRRREGSVETLRRLEDRFGHQTIVVDAVERPLTDQTIVRASSSMIRWLLQRGRVGDAAILLDRPYTLLGDVVPGDKRGRELGFPTANLDVGDLLIPADGVYAGIAELADGRRFASAVSIGVKPTFGEHQRVCEVHMLDYDGPVDEYGWTMRLESHAWIRQQARFGGMDELISAIHRDIEHTRQVLDWAPAATCTGPSLND